MYATDPTRRAHTHRHQRHCRSFRRYPSFAAPAVKRLDAQPTLRAVGYLRQPASRPRLKMPLPEFRPQTFRHFRCPLQKHRDCMASGKNYRWIGWTLTIVSLRGDPQNPQGAGPSVYRPVRPLASRSLLGGSRVVNRLSARNGLERQLPIYRQRPRPTATRTASIVAWDQAVGRVAADFLPPDRLCTIPCWRPHKPCVRRWRRLAESEERRQSSRLRRSGRQIHTANRIEPPVSAGRASPLRRVDTVQDPLSHL